MTRRQVCRGRRLLARVVTAAVALPAAVAAAQNGRIEPDTGRDLAHWPPPRHFDHIHMVLQLDIPDMHVRHFHGRMALSIEAIGRERDRLVLDAVGLDIHGVTADGRPQPFEYDGQQLVVHLHPPVRAGEQVAIQVNYSARAEHASGAGLTWTLGDPQADSLTARSPQIHSQGQPESNRTWFPCHDFPNEQLTCELIVTVDSDYQVCANGRLVDRRLEPDGRSTWYWVQDQPLSAYLVALVIGRFTIVDVGGPTSARPGLPMPVYVPAGMGARARDVFGRTPDMVAYFESLFDEPYPFDKYAQAVVRNFRAGAMENTSLVTFAGGALYWGEDAETIIAHELAHHWFGDMVFYRSWEHLWLGEGWATFAEALWTEHTRGRSAYLRRIREFLVSQTANDTTAPSHPALVSNHYPMPDANFFKANNPYTLGALVLHMLRERLGDEVFFDGVRQFIDRYRFRTAETDDFRRVLEEVSGQSLERFFRQWCYQPGLPRFEVDLDWTSEPGVLLARARQAQTIDGDNPAYAVEIPLYVQYEDGQGQYVYLPTETIEASARFELGREPIDVLVDPNITIAARWRVRRGEGAATPATEPASAW